MKKESLNIKGINQLSPNELKNIQGGSFIGKLMHGIGYVIGFLGGLASDLAAGASNFVGD